MAFALLCRFTANTEDELGLAWLGQEGVHRSMEFAKQLQALAKHEKSEEMQSILTISERSCKKCHPQLPSNSGLEPLQEGPEDAPRTYFNDIIFFSFQVYLKVFFKIHNRFDNHKHIF